MGQVISCFNPSFNWHNICNGWARVIPVACTYSWGITLLLSLFVSYLLRHSWNHGSSNVAFSSFIQLTQYVYGLSSCCSTHTHMLWGRTLFLSLLVNHCAAHGSMCQSMSMFRFLIHLPRYAWSGSCYSTHKHLLHLRKLLLSSLVNRDPYLHRLWNQGPRNNVFQSLVHLVWCL